MPRRALREDHGKLGLLFARAELDEEVEDFVDDFLRARVLAIDLVDHDDGFEIQLERFAQHETRLRHHAFGGVDQQEHALHHLQNALDLAAEVGVTGRVDDVELDVAVANRGVLGKNRNTALFFERVGIHHTRFDVLALAKDAALLEHRVDEGGLPMIDMGNNSDVTNIRTSFHGPACFDRTRANALVLSA